MQKISLFHLFISETQSSLKSHDQTGHTHFLTMPTQKIFGQLLVFMNMYQHAKNQLFHLFILQIESVLEPSNQTGHTHFDHAHPKIFNHLLISMNWYQHAKNQIPF